MGVSVCFLNSEPRGDGQARAVSYCCCPVGPVNMAQLASLPRLSGQKPQKRGLQMCTRSFLSDLGQDRCRARRWHLLVSVSGRECSGSLTCGPSRHSRKMSGWASVTRILGLAGCRLHCCGRVEPRNVGLATRAT